MRASKARAKFFRICSLVDKLPTCIRYFREKYKYSTFDPLRRFHPITKYLTEIKYNSLTLPK